MIHPCDPPARDKQRSQSSLLLTLKNIIARGWGCTRWGSHGIDDRGSIRPVKSGANFDHPNPFSTNECAWNRFGNKNKIISKNWPFKIIETFPPWTPRTFKLVRVKVDSENLKISLEEIGEERREKLDKFCPKKFREMTVTNDVGDVRAGAGQ